MKVLDKYSSLIKPRLINNVEAYLVFDKPAHKTNTEAKIYVLLNNHGMRRNLSYKVASIDGNKEIISKQINIEEKKFIVETIPIETPDKPGKFCYKLLVDNEQADTTCLLVGDPSSREQIYFTIVWHHHQAPNYLPDGRIHGPWAYIYVWSDLLKPYGKGPYHYHSLMLKIHPHFKATYNLSPSLLQQWQIAIEKGVEFTNGEKYDPSHEKIKLVEETLNNYREALFKGQIDVLTSIYAHTIGGFLTDVLGATDIVEEEIRYGKEVTSKIMGNNYSPQGIWTPEMAFSMKLIPIYYDLDIKYTVLDDKFHFFHAGGNKDSQYEPYMVIDTESKKYITVFFRDHDLSDILGFRNNFYSEPHAWRNAYEFALRVAEKWIDKNSKILVVALDGENWMSFSVNPPLTAYFLDKMIIYLEMLADNKFIKLSTLREIYNKVPANRILTNIPTNSWLGTFRKWRGEVPQHEEYWVKTYSAYRKLLAYEEMIGGRDEFSNKARWALWHALDSDYWWAEFWLPKIIDTWLREAENILNERMNKIQIIDARLASKLYEGGKADLIVTIRNQLEKEIRVSFTIGGIGFSSINNDLETVKMNPSSSYTRIIPVKAKFIGEQKIVVSAISKGLIIDSKVIDIDVKPKLPPNPR
ncbi:glycoside hydrolase family 57 protein [Staphylothermus hellenicus]|uniref:Glycoside hydrolase family 57 n=1 Tax=Staphylothermus hellenicus (strain DSM 12710 / JCM 10830 / BK20S6-10-b1 / P8) TaxID=591019 RepID=D7D8P8_STAHD|nr:glycoside hydrolase family 57 protein [Staphylothermus hellenicus]ADI32144.1 glycoside hydrolase family 57 [Staphylothermus hellenicus DSM 12710]